MSFSAYVRCNCYKEGKLSSKPPFAEHVYEDDQGLWLRLDWREFTEEHRQFDQWLEAGPCEHKGMDLCYERLANITGMNAFLTILDELGNENYPILSGELGRNGGILFTDLVPNLQSELERFNKTKHVEKQIFLKETITNQEIAKVNWNGEFVKMYYKTLRFLIAKDGFFIGDKKDKNSAYYDVLFHASLFSQRKLSEQEFLFVNVDTSEEYISERGLYEVHDSDQEYFEFQLAHREVPITEEYQYIIKPLEKLVKASIQSGNPIVWC